MSASWLSAFSSFTLATLAFARVPLGALAALGSLSSLAGLASLGCCCPALLILGPMFILFGIELAAWTGALAAGVSLGLADEAPLFFDGEALMHEVA